MDQNECVPQPIIHLVGLAGQVTSERYKGGCPASSDLRKGLRPMNGKRCASLNIYKGLASFYYQPVDNAGFRYPKIDYKATPRLAAGYPSNLISLCVLRALHCDISLLLKQIRDCGWLHWPAKPPAPVTCDRFLPIKCLTECLNTWRPLRLCESHLLSDLLPIAPRRQDRKDGKEKCFSISPNLAPFAPWSKALGVMLGLR